MKYDTRLLYLCSDSRCPVPVSVRLPTGSCRRGCFFCCQDSAFGSTRLGLRHILTEKTFLRLWRQIIINNDFKFAWPRGKIEKALKNNKILRFVREDLFEPSISEITETVLSGCYRAGYGLLVKTSSVNIVNYISELKKIKHCIVFSVTDLLQDYQNKVKAINECVRGGLKVTLSLSPIFEYNKKIKYIISKVNQKILGVEVGWLHGKSSLFPEKILNRPDYKYIRWEKQYKKSHLENTVNNIFVNADLRDLKLRFYFSSNFFQGGACCFVDEI